MRVFQSLKITGNEDQLTKLVDIVQKDLSGGWTRDVRHEQKVKGFGNADTSYCFACDATAGREAAQLWLFLRRRESALKVGNIVPTTKRELSYDDYNLILNDFFDSFVKPTLRKLGLEASLSKADVTFEDFASPKTAELLRRFARTANRSTGSSHPSDNEAWQAFIISAHMRGEQIYTDILRRCLIEEEHWPDEQAFELVIEYEQGRSLLKAYDSLRSRR